jgi:MoaA/NifB/PqqE/SkfB family radical SAM enzyme
MKHYHFDGHKLIYHMERVYKHYRDNQRIFPLHIDIGATKLCNAKCVYCYGTFQKMSGDIISRESLLDIFGTAVKLGIKSITITGDGEPTLNPDIYEAISLGKTMGLDIGFATNGIFLSPEKLAVLLDNCTWVRFNLSAVSREGYKRIHGVDLFNTVQENIAMAVELKKLYESTTTLGLQMVLIPDALPEIIPEAKFALANELDYFVIKQFSDPGCEEMSRFALDWYDNPEVMETLKVAQSLSTEQTHIVPKWDMMHSKGIRQYDRCVDCALLFQISGNSKCYPCGYLFGNDKYCYGDLKTQTLKEILDSEKYWNVVRYMREQFDVHKDCTGCCRHDFTNKFIFDFLNPPEHLNFI